MKIAVLSDVHGNLPALQVVTAHLERWGPDVVVVNGDVVNRGPRSHACWQFVQSRRERDGWRVTGGNHETFVAGWREPDRPREGAQFAVHRSSYWTYRQLGRRVGALAELPTQVGVVGPDGEEIRATHGSMQGRSDGIYPETTAADLARKIKPAPAVFCAAHTHRPLIRALDGTLVVNSGSAGTSFDGDPRAGYAQLVRRRKGWQARIVRLAYDREQMARDFVTSGFLGGAGPLARIFFEEWFRARPLVNRWAERYEVAVLAGEIGLAQSVTAFLADPGRHK